MKALLLALLAAAPLRADPPVDRKAWLSVDKAFAAGEPIPEAKFAGAEQSVYQLMKKVSEGCVQPCKTEAYLKNIALIGRARKLADVPKIQAVYCPGSPAVCRARRSAQLASRPAPGAPGPAGREAVVERARKAGEAALKTGTGMAGSLAQDKSDNLPGPGGAEEEEEDLPEPAPAGKAAPADAPAPPKTFAAVRDDGTERAAGAAADALRGLPGGKAKDLLARLEAAGKIADPAKRAEARRALLTEADAGFEALFSRELAREAAAARAAACAGKKGKARNACLAAKPGDAELDGARKKALEAAPALGLYFVSRAEHQLKVKEALAAGELPAGARLEPWELGVPAPPGTTITVAADKDEKAAGGTGGLPFLGLSFALPDGSTRFEGQRPGDDGKPERLIVARGAKGETTRAVFSERASRTQYFAPGGRLVRSEASSYGGAHVEIKDYNLKGPERELRRYEIRDKKNGKIRVEVRDPDNLRNTVTDYDGSVVVTSRLQKGLPVDPKQPDGSRWTEQRGRMVNGRFQLEQVTLEDKTVLKGSSSTGRFLVTEVNESGGRRLRGTSDPRTGAFQPTSVIEKDGSGQRKSGRVMVTMGPGGKTLRLAVSLKDEKPTRDNMMAIAAEFAGAAGLDDDKAGALGEWLYDRARRVNYAVRGEDGIRDAVLATGKPGAEVALLRVERVSETDADGVVLTGKVEDKIAGQDVARWESASAFQGATGTVLRALNENGVPVREYVSEGRMRQWFSAYSNDGGAGLFSSSKQYEHAMLVEFTRDPKNPRKWISECGDENDVTLDDPKKPCASREQVGKPQVIHTTASGLSDLGAELGDIPVVGHIGKYATKGYYTSVGYLQDDIGFDTSKDPNKRLAVIANKYRGVVSTEETLYDLKSDPELLMEVDEKVVEKRKKQLAGDCVRMGERDCDAYARRLNCADETQKRPCATNQERIDVVRYAYSPSHAIDYASEGGSKFLYVLGGLGQAGEMAAASLPTMGLTYGVGALGKVKYVGGAANFGNAALNGYMMTGWAVGGLANAGDLVEGIKDGDMAKVVRSGVQSATDFVFVYKGHADGKARAAEKARVEKALAAERERLRKIEALPDEGFSSLQLDLSKASAADIAKYKEALQKLGIPEPVPEQGIAEFMISPRKRAQIEEMVKGTKIESIDMAETGVRQSDRKPFSADEVDAMFAGRKDLNDTVRLDLSEFPPKDYPILRKAVQEAGGKWADPVDGVVELSVPHGKGAELVQKVAGTPAKVLKPGEAARSAPAEGDVVAVGTAKEIDRLWDYRNGENLTHPDTVRNQRGLAFQNAGNPTLRKAVEAAEAAGEIAPASWQGRQGQEGNCVPHALANASNGVFKLPETVKAGKDAGADYTKSGTSEKQLLEMMVALEAQAAARGVDVDYRAVEPREYFRQQAEAAKAGRPRQAAVAVIRTGTNPTDIHGLHAVALRGQIIVGGKHYIVVTDSHLNKPLLYTPDGFASAIVSNGVVLIDAAPRAAQAKKP